MSVVVSQQEVGPCRKQLVVEVPAPAVEAEFDRVLREYGREVRVPGFRKGKVPQDLVRRRFAKEIEHEVVERLLPRYWRQAEAETELQPLLPPDVDEVGEFAPGQPLRFTATVETRPKIELRDLGNFDLPDPAVEPGEVDVDLAIDELRQRHGTWKPVDRPAARGDLVKAEISAEPQGDAPPEMGPQEIEVEVGDPRVWEELSLALSGLAAGQEATLTRQEGEPPIAKHFRVHATTVAERELPVLDDAFAQHVSAELADVAALRTAVSQRLKAARASDRDDQRQRALLDQLRGRYPLELPQGVVRQELEQLLGEYAESLHRRGLDGQRGQIDWEGVRSEMQPIAERRVHARLLLDAIAEAESIAVTDEEFERSLAAIARLQGVTTPALRRSLDENGRLAGVRSQLRRDKVLRRLLGEVAPAAVEAGAGTATPPG